MVGKRLAVLVLLLLSSGVSVVSSLILVQRMSLATVDFKWIYNGARCMLQRSDPYLGSDFLHVYLVEGGTCHRASALKIFRIGRDIPTRLLHFSLLSLSPCSREALRT